MTTLKLFQDAFSSVRVGTYEPLIVRWISIPTIDLLHRFLVVREPIAVTGAKLQTRGGDAAPTAARYVWRRPGGVALQAKALDSFFDMKPTSSPGFWSQGWFGQIPPTPIRATIPAHLIAEAKVKSSDNPVLRIGQILQSKLNSVNDLVKTLDTAQLANFLPLQILEALSPIGITHLYRQLYFDLDAGLGPIEQMFSIAPREEVEVVQETIRRQVSEQIEEWGVESTRESEESFRNLDEISDQVTNSIQYDTSVAVSGEAGGSYGVYTFGGQASTSLAASAEQSQTFTNKNVREVNHRSAERIRKSYKLQVRTLSEVTDRSTMRRLIRNESDEPVNYALRRVLRRVRVKLQYLGPRLCWQLYVSRPGEGLARGEFVIFSPSDDIFTPEIPPGAPPYPQGGKYQGNINVIPDPNQHYIEILIGGNPYQKVVALSIDRFWDAGSHGGTKPGVTQNEYMAPTITGDTFEQVSLSAEETALGKAKFRISIDPGNAEYIGVQYTVDWEPSPVSIAAWQAQVDTIRADLVAAAIQERAQTDFENKKKEIAARSRIAPRPAADLRKEERYEILQRMVSTIFGSGGSSGTPMPLEIEYFHRFFDEQGIFYYPHPSWWQPRYAASVAGLERDVYQITEDSDPAPLGSSIGWMIQTDGDRRRNEFINSLWARVCVPIRPGREREAVMWLARRLEGEVGFDLAPTNVLGKLIQEIENRREQEKTVTEGPQYVTVDGTIAPNSNDAANAYPVVSEFDVVLPTDGFAYDSVTIDATP